MTSSVKKILRDKIVAAGRNITFDYFLIQMLTSVANAVASNPNSTYSILPTRLSMISYCASTMPTRSSTALSGLILYLRVTVGTQY